VLMMLSTATLGACSAQDAKGSVTVLGPRAGTKPGSEGYRFRKVLSAFTAKTGIQVHYQDARSLSEVLASSFQGGTPPDVAILSGIGDLAKYAGNHMLHRLDDVIDKSQQAAFPRLWLLPLDGHIYTVPIKANVKSLIWDNKARPPASIQTWDDLVAYTRSIADSGGTPWCMGIGDAPNPGWPGTDLIEDILLHKSGPDLYQQWVAGILPWRSKEVKEAWLTWGRISTDPRLVYGGPRAGVFTHFLDAGRPMLFSQKPRGYLDHEASFIMGFYQNHHNQNRNTQQPGTDFDFFPFPKFDNQNASSPLEVSTDLAGMFNDTPQARRLMQFLASDEAQRIWPALPGGSAFTVDRNVPPSVSPDAVS